MAGLVVIFQMIPWVTSKLTGGFMPVRYQTQRQKVGSLNHRFKHGHNNASGQSPTYKSWDNMITRCTRPSHHSYPRYGGAGVTVCARWMDFCNFLADMGERPSGKTLDRIDRTRGYEPGNCRWATPKEQARNSNKPKAVIRSDGKRYASVIDAAVDVGVSYTGIVKVCNNAYGCKTSGGFGWAYFTEGQ